MNKLADNQILRRGAQQHAYEVADALVRLAENIRNEAGNLGNDTKPAATVVADLLALDYADAQTDLARRALQTERMAITEQMEDK